MKVKYYGVFTCKEYIENGETKKSWYRVGYIKEREGGGRFLTLSQQPSTEFYIFEDNDEK